MKQTFNSRALGQLLLLGILWPGPIALALDYDYGKEVKYEKPVREHAIIVTKEGYYPKQISIFEGEKIRFFVTSTLPSPSCLLLPEKKIFLSATKGQIAEGEAYFSKPGSYKFYCPNGGITGNLRVLQKIDQEKKVKRKIASVKIWRPRDE